jgi:hypothetical protein
MSNGYSKAFSQYGASMGRRAGDAPLEGELCKLHRVPLDSGGYDPGGAYWGIEGGPGMSGPGPLWRLQCDGGDHFVRATDRFRAFLKLSSALQVSFRVRP